MVLLPVDTSRDCSILNNVTETSVIIQSFTADNNASLVPLLMKTCHSDKSENEEAKISATCFS